MKKISALILCLMLGSFILAGCSEDSAPFEQKEYTADASQIEEIRRRPTPPPRRGSSA